LPLRWNQRFLHLVRNVFLSKILFWQKNRVHKIVSVPVITHWWIKTAGRTNALSIINSLKAIKETDIKTVFSLFVDGSQIRNLRPQTIQYYRNELSVFFKILRGQNINTSFDTFTKEYTQRKVILYINDKRIIDLHHSSSFKTIRAIFNFLQRESTSNKTHLVKSNFSKTYESCWNPYKWTTPYTF